jgi:ABC-2 type transport system ATP-binding protein
MIPDTQNHASIASLQAVSHSYGSTKALNALSFDIMPGGIIALLGPNGAGKTTAINLLLGLLTPDQGRVTLFGQDAKHPQSRTRVGTMLQLSGVPETLKVKEHIDLFRAYYPAPLPFQDIIQFAGLEGLEDRLYSKLSGGQRQRLHLALAIAGNPELLFLDEPTTGLDVTARRSLWTHIRQFANAGRTVLLTTHHLEEADHLAQRILVLRQGQLIADGSPSEIKTMVAGKQIRLRTTLTQATIKTMADVVSVEQQGELVTILTNRAEPVVREILIRDETASELEVSSASLEEAFLSLTQERQRAA